MKGSMVEKLKGLLGLKRREQAQLDSPDMKTGSLVDSSNHPVQGEYKPPTIMDPLVYTRPIDNPLPETSSTPDPKTPASVPEPAEPQTDQKAA